MKPERMVSVAFGISIVASIGLIVVYLAGGQTQLEGVLLGFALGGLGLGIVWWASRLMHEPEQTEEREPLSSTEERAETGEVLDAEEVTRRSLLIRLLAAAGGTLAAALAIPSLSLGPAPGRSLFRTQWKPGLRVVDVDGNPLRPGDISLESVTTIFPAGEVGSADSQALVVRVDPTDLSLPEGRSDWTPEGVVAYSKICTHAGCPVGLYRAEARELLCPCHQSTFDVLRGAEPVFGPAARALPQLPLEVDDEGYLIAQGDFSAPVGPSFWNLTSDEDG